MGTRTDGSTTPLLDQFTDGKIIAQHRAVLVAKREHFLDQSRAALRLSVEGTIMAIALPLFVIVIVSPFSTRSRRRYRWILASCRPTDFTHNPPL